MKDSPFGAARLVQLPDVLHDSLIRAALGDRAPEVPVGTTCLRRLVWYLEDCAGNLVAIVPDAEVAAVREQWGLGDADVVAWAGDASKPAGGKR